MRTDWFTAGLNLKAPLATYRVQLNRDFKFCDLKAVVPYLAKLGVSHIYASPIFKARAGSMHGYDVVDPTIINEELGGAAGFEELIKEISMYGLGWIQDIVPNHAAYSLENKKVVDVLQNGQGSRYSKFFDVDWNHPSPKLNGRILAPFLGKELSECIKQGEITLAFDGGVFKIKYAGLEFPVNRKSDQKLFQEKEAEQTVKRYNSNPELLAGLLSEQFYALTFWKDALREINYRRFFDILDLIGVRIEEQAVFEETQRLALNLLLSGKISGLRVDHIDGLHDPEKYLQTLCNHNQDAYLLVEKILTNNETLPETWPIQGSTGYDFINQVNGLFVKQENEAAIDDLYKGITGNTQNFSDQLFESKQNVVNDYFLGDINNLARLITQTARKLGQNQFDPDKMPNAVATLIACFPVYRTYLNPKNQTDTKDHFKEALKQAKHRKPEYTSELDTIEDFLHQSEVNSDALGTIMKIQQFTGAAMAKGLEDTTFYRYCRFLSLNEVGGDPSKFGSSIEEFHDFNLSRQTRWPLTLNASSTHDTKRGEDARARLNVLSEMPQELKTHVYKWMQVNNKHKIIFNGESVPDCNEEYMIYQTLLGAYPFEEKEKQEFTQRAADYVVKALREAKTHTSWLNPNQQYEKAAQKFIQESLKDPDFLEDFLPFQKQISHYGVYNTLSQTLLKITCPGVPDFYQGSELWNLSMVDPDNRRPVDYQKRQQFLEEVSRIRPSGARGLLKDYTSGKAKLYLIFKALQVRRRFKNLFEEGAYLPLPVEGCLKGHVFAFMRKKQGKFVVVVVPRFLVELLENPNLWEVDWKDTAVKLPTDAPSTWKEALTVSSVQGSNVLLVGKVLEGFPVALLVGGGNN
jgi:(1->4)-alpha-D-glucan 1-alpha-D-glucosylmutase